MTDEEHADLCKYLDDWLVIWNELRHQRKLTSEHWDQAKLINDTLIDLILIDAEKAGL